MCRRDVAVCSMELGWGIVVTSPFIVLPWFAEIEHQSLGALAFVPSWVRWWHMMFDDVHEHAYTKAVQKAFKFSGAKAG